MSDLQTLLDGAVDHHVDLDVDADLRRGRSALRRRRLTFVAGVAAAVLVIGGTFAGLARSSVLPLQPSHSKTATVHAGAFVIPPPPDGWSVQAADASLVVIAPDGLPKVDLHDPNLNLPVAGKLVINLVPGGIDSPNRGPTIEFDGRSFFDNERGGSNTTQVGVREPSGAWLVLQEAPSLQWTVQQMIEYLDAVVVTPDAVPDPRA
jgi:hypothetical protein